MRARMFALGLAIAGLVMLAVTIAGGAQSMRAQSLASSPVSSSRSAPDHTSSVMVKEPEFHPDASTFSVTRERIALSTCAPLLPGGLCVYYGDLHSHTSYSDGQGTPEEAYQTARANGLDFLSITDHAELLSQSEWEDTWVQAWAATVDDTFVALRGFEWTSGAFGTKERGHINAFNTDDYVGVNNSNYNALGEIYDWLADPAQLKGIAQFNHPHIPDDSFRNLQYVQAVDPHINLIETRVGGGISADKYRIALANGWHVAPTNNSDTHWANWGQRRGRTGILAPALTYHHVMEALRARRVFSTEDEDLALAMRAGGYWMGAVLREDPVQLDIYALDPAPDDPFATLTLFQDNEPLTSTVVNTNTFTWQVPLTAPHPVGTQWYVEAIQADGDQAFAAPIWIHRPQSYDVSMRDNIWDTGHPPSADPVWQSPDVWIRRQADGGIWHENPVTGEVNTVYAQVQNAGIDVVTDVDVRFYWATPSLGPAWPDDWHLINDVPTRISLLRPGETTVVSVPWDVPETASYHVALLVRLISAQDPIGYEGAPKWENNICWKNVHLVDHPDGGQFTAVPPISATFYLANPHVDERPVDLRFFGGHFPPQGSLTLRLAPDLFARWSITDTSSLVKGAIVDPTSGTITITAPGNAAVYGLPLQAGERSTATLSFRFPVTSTLALHVSEEIDGEEVGGSLYTTPSSSVFRKVELEAEAARIATNESIDVVAHVVGDGFVPVVDGTEVHFSTTLGHLSTDTVRTQGGLATVTLTSGIVPGMAILQARVGDLTPAATRVEIYRTCWARLNDESEDYLTVQAALDASTHLTDVVKVAGRCFTVNDRAGLTQVVYVSKTLTVRGGYTVTEWTTPDPLAHPTTLDAQGLGRVVYVADGVSLTVEGMRITGGEARDLGGGLSGKDAGGGIYAANATVAINGCHVLGNLADDGGGVYVSAGDATLVNSVIADNRGEGQGNGLYVGGGTARLAHNTLARNDPLGGSGSAGSEGSGIYVADNSLMTLTNTILTNHAVAISVTAGSTVSLEATLWGSGAWANDLDWQGEGTIFTGTLNYRGDPVFVDPDGGDYHIGATSVARDRGVDAGVGADIDGEIRPMGHGYDVGADELRIGLSIAKYAGADPVRADERLTYAIYVTNTGKADLNASIVDVLPTHIAAGETTDGSSIVPGGTLTWSAVITAPNGIWRQGFAVTVEAGYRGMLTNVVQVTTDAGARGVYTETSAAIVVHDLYLPLLMRRYTPPVPCAPRLIRTVHTGPESYGVALDTTGRRAFVAHAEGLTVVNVDSFAIITTVRSLTSTHGVVYDPDRDRIWVTTRKPDRVIVLSGATYAKLSTLPAGDGPHSPAYNSANGRVYVTNYWGGTVGVYDAETLTHIAELTDFAEPAHIAVNPITNKIYVANHGFYRGLVVIDGETHARHRVDTMLFDAYGVAIDTTRNLVYVTAIAQGRISVVDGTTDEELGYQDIHHDDGRSVWLRVIAVNPGVGPEGHLLLVTSSDDGERDQVLLIPNGWPTLGTPVPLDIASYPQEGIALDPTRNRVWVTSVSSGLVSVVQNGEPVCSLEGD